jgi:hypothetical protein
MPDLIFDILMLIAAVIALGGAIIMAWNRIF